MNFPKINMWLLIVVIAIGLACLYFLITNKKKTDSQQSVTDLLLDLSKNINYKEAKEVTEEKADADFERVKEISEKIYFKKPLTAGDLEFKQNNEAEIAEDLKYCALFYPLVDKFLKGEKDFTDSEKEFYEANKEEVDGHLNRLKTTETTLPIAHAQLNEITSTQDLKKSSPPMAKEEREKLILSMFEDGVPKNVSELADQYSRLTNTKPSKGNISTMFGKMEGTLLLCQEIKHGSRWKVYYGLPQWFDGKKMKKEYKLKIKA